MKKIFKYLFSLVMLIALASCTNQNQTERYDVNYYYGYKLLTTMNVEANSKIVLELENIHIDSLNISMAEYVENNLEENQTFEYWYSDTTYNIKYNPNYKITGKTNVYGKLTTTIETPDDPVVPDTPVEPDDPVVPDTPVEPDDPVVPDTPAVPGDMNGDGVVDSVETYYLSAFNLTGSALKTELHHIVENTHKKKLSYSECWSALKQADKGSKANTVECIYTGVDINASDQDGSSSASIVWNREHSWPNSKGFPNKSLEAYCDINHLFASEKNINSTRGNKDFGEVSSGASSDKYGNKWTSSYFEPRDEVKGDLARVMFYMVVRYDGDTCSKCTLDLELVVGLSTSYSNSSNVCGYLGDLATLIKWHYEDPVSQDELQRNEVVYSIQGNRNPFIDFPQYVLELYPDLATQYVQ